jgi:hypothetical protein
MASPLISKSAESAEIVRCVVYKNGDKSTNVEIGGGIYKLSYYESILQDTVRVTIDYVDSGYTINNTTLLEGLPLIGQERVELEIADNNNNTKKVTLYVNSILPGYNDQNKQIVTIDLVSKEFILNEQVRVKKRYDGKISDHVEKILKDQPPFGLGTKKDTNIEQTVNLYNFIGNNKKPLYVCSLLSKKSIPTTGGGKGKTAGYFFFETDKGFVYKSIDTLMKQEPKSKLIYTTTVDQKGEKIPAGYDGKILEYNVDSVSNNLQQKYKMGLYNTKIVKFDPFNCFYEVVNQQASDSYEKGGKQLPKLNDDEFPNKETNAATKTSYYLIDTGTLPTGDTKQQLEKSKEKNFEETEIVNNATMRYNNLFATKVSITIPGLFKLSAGDTIYVDSPKIEAANEPDVNQQFGGKYLISHICHYITQKRSFSSLKLVRESVGRQASSQ